jgi:peptidoglycan LD-endopeptidase LytH
VYDVGAHEVRLSARGTLVTVLGAASLVLLLFSAYRVYSPTWLFVDSHEEQSRSARAIADALVPRSSRTIESASPTLIDPAPSENVFTADAESSDGSDASILIGPREISRTAGSDATSSKGRLLIPVAGVRPEELVDTYTQSRSQGRRHDAIDIAAPHGTSVLAVAEGTVLKLFQSEQGGITLYQLDPDNRTLYYYAHLGGYAPGVVEGMRLRRGETIGFVGDTGNAGAGNYHLHFEISITLDPKQYWGGTPMNPFALLGGTS